MFSLVPRLSGVVVLRAVSVVMLAAVVGLGVALTAQRPGWWDGLVIPLLVGLGALGVVITVIAGRVKLHR
jgi:hypothetical protein